MTARTHDLAAFTFLAIATASQPVSQHSLATVLLVLLANQIGGIAPDIDQPTAPFWRNLPIGRLFGKVFDNLTGGHRFLTHSLLGMVLAGGLFRLLLNFLHPIMLSVDTGLVWWAFMLGMLSHLVMDTFTQEGVPWLLPIPFKFGFPPLRAIRITTGQLAEKSLFIILLIFNFWFFSNHYPNFVSIFHAIG